VFALTHPKYPGGASQFIREAIEEKLKHEREAVGQTTAPPVMPTTRQEQEAVID
jgi:hypothetical protein